VLSSFRWFRIGLSLLLVIPALGGCTISRDGPQEKLISEASADLSGFTLIDMTAARVSNYRISRPADSAGTVAVPSAPPISLSSGDVLKVRISEAKEGGIFAPLALGGTVFDNLRVMRPTTEYLLAMKCLASRVGPISDRADVITLLHLLKMYDSVAICNLVCQYYSERLLAPKVRFFSSKKSSRKSAHEHSFQT
jgi:hypothetical protein